MNYIVETEIVCPFCGEAFATAVDTSQGDVSTIEDCTVCCRPFVAHIEIEDDDVHVGVEAS